MFRGLRVRLTIVCAVSTGLVLVGMAVASYLFSSAQMRRQFEQSFHSSGVSVTSYIQTQNIIFHTWLMRTEEENDIWIDVTTPLASMGYTRRDPERAEILQRVQQIAREQYSLLETKSLFSSQTESAEFIMEADGIRYRVFLTQIPFGDTERHITVVKNTASEQQTLSQLLLRFILSVLVSMGLSVLFAWLLSRWATKPVEESRKQQVEFVHAASHELRAPISVIQMGVESMRGASSDKFEQFSDMILRECSRLTRLTGDMLRLASTDSRKFTINREIINPEAPLLSIYENYEELMKPKQIAFELLYPAAELPQITCDPQRIEQILAILLDNAIRFTPQGGRIQMGLQTLQGKVCYTVTDSGPGIPGNEKKSVFQRFYQSDRSRSSKYHFGLGLSIAWEIAELHKGKLEVTDAVLGGCTFTLHLPINRFEKH